MTTTPRGYVYEPADVDTTSIEMLPDPEILFAFKIRLAGTPDAVWKRAFESVWKESRYMNKLEATVIGDGVRFICRQSQGMEDYLYFIESRIEKTNRIVEGYWSDRGARTERLTHQPYPETFQSLGVFSGSQDSRSGGCGCSTS